AESHIPMKPGFTITSEETQRCLDKAAIPAGNTTQAGDIIDEDLEKVIEENLAKIEKATGRKFGSTSKPLLVSIRSDAVIAIPGRDADVLNVGINEKIAAALAEETGNHWFAWDTYLRFIKMYGYLTSNKYEFYNFNQLIKERMTSKRVDAYLELTADDLQQLCAEFIRLIDEETDNPFPRDPKTQLRNIINAAIAANVRDKVMTHYRVENIEIKYTAITVQAMAFGNFNEKSAIVSCLSRNPRTGEKSLWGNII
ncbi:MAG: hypothetical protein ABII23_04325, partial [bacterium]